LDHPEIPCPCEEPILVWPPNDGYVEGVSLASAFGLGDISGVEIVYDFATMTRSEFTYEGKIGGITAGVGLTAYAGPIWGFTWDNEPTNTQIWFDYQGRFEGGYAGLSVGLFGFGLGFFHSPDWKIGGYFSYASIGVSIPPGEIVGFETDYKPKGNIDYYANSNGKVNTGLLLQHILSGNKSPILVGPLASATSVIGGPRLNAAVRALQEVPAFEIYWRLHPPSQTGPR
jgi:hypothetical protein